METNKSVTPERIMQLAWGYAPPLIIQAAVENGVFDLLAESSRTVAELAAASGASERGLKAILNALVGLQLLAKEGERYKLTAESEAFLVSSKPGYYGGFFRHISEQLIPQWLPLTKVVRTGQPATRMNDPEKGAEFFADFVEALFPMSYKGAQALGEHLQISAAAQPISVLDIGAGSGVWGIALAQQSPKVRIRAVDWPRVLQVTEKVARRCGVADRLTLAPGDLLDADFGRGHQVATIGHILHSEGVERSQRLLRKTFEALAPGGHVAIMEFVPDDDRTGPPMPLLFAVNMLVNTDRGDVFSFAEMRSWLEQAGFVNARLVDIPAVSPLVLATRP